MIPVKLPVTANAAAVTERVFSRFEDAVGTISRDDSLFLLSLRDILNAKTIFEVGVASGSSTSLMLTALNEAGPDGHLYGFDIASSYYAEPSKPLAFLVDKLNIDKGKLTIFPETISAAALQRLVEHGNGHRPQADILFIDAHHCHPWASLDLLAMLPGVRKNGCIVMHDIALPDISNHGAEFGPKYLFHALSSPRFMSDVDVPNIGAVIVDDVHKMIDETIACLRQPWEFSPGDAVLSPVQATLATVATREQQQELSDLFDPYR